MSYVLFQVEDEVSKRKQQSSVDRGIQTSMWDLTPSESFPVTHTIAASIRSSFRPGMSPTFGTIQDTLCNEYFGKATERHFRDACRILINEGKINYGKKQQMTDRTILPFI